MPSIPKEERLQDPRLEPLRKLQDEYHVLELEYEKELAVMRQKYEERQQVFLKEREELFEKEPETFADFWVEALQSHPTLAEEIEEWDLPVLSCLKNIRTESLPDPSGKDEKGFKLIFEFGENEYFENEKLVVSFSTDREVPFLSTLALTEIVVDEEIEWKENMDVTVEEVKKKRSGGGAKKNNKNKQSIKARPSFFRTFFATDYESVEGALELMQLKAEEQEMDMDELDGEEEQFLDQMREDLFECGQTIKSQLIPYAVKFYTGEADAYLDGEDDDDLDNEEDEEDEDEDEELNADEIKEAVKSGAFGNPTGSLGLMGS